MKNVGYNNSVAVIGANSKAGKHIATAICKAYRVLLMDTDAMQTTTLANEIRNITQSPEAVETLTCSKDASWEADVIVLVVPVALQPAIAQKIAEVATCKTILQIISENTNHSSIQNLLPHSNVVSVTLHDTTAIVQGKNKVAVQLAIHLLSFTHWKIVEKKVYKLKENKQQHNIHSYKK